VNLAIQEVVIEPLLVADLIAQSEDRKARIRSLTAAELSNAEAAIQRCTGAAAEAKRAAEASGMTAKECRYRSIMAFKVNIPRMDTSDGCIEATACIVNGYLAGFFDGQEVSKLLYAAQIAQSLLRGAK
jgi:hypothetical protein